MSKKCVNCGQELPDHAKFCNKCGGNAADAIPVINESISNVIVCPQCGQQLKPSANFCNKCGMHIEKADSYKTGEQLSLSRQILNTMMNMSPQAGFQPIPEIPLQQNHTSSVATPFPSRPKRLSHGIITGIVLSIVGIIIVVLLVCVSLYTGTTGAINSLQDVTFNDWGESTFGDAVSHTLTSVEWEASEGPKDEEFYVTVSGYHDIWEANISVTFHVTYSDVYAYAEAIKCKLNDVESEDLEDISVVMSMIYDDE